MFRRSTPEPELPPTHEKVGGKGRPTPSRKEAEAAARARAKVPRTRKEQAAAQRAARGDASRKMREAIKTGDERYLPSRDRGPVRRFIRDFVDSRFSFIELMVPPGDSTPTLRRFSEGIRALRARAAVAA